MFHRFHSGLWIAGVSVLFTGLVVGDAGAACPTCGTQAAPSQLPPAYRCRTCGQMVYPAPGSPRPANPPYGWYAPPARTPYANYGYYGPRYSAGYPGYASPWVLNRQSAGPPAPRPAGLVPAPLPDPNFAGDIAYPPVGYYGVPRESYDLDRYNRGYIADSPWIRERRAQCFDDREAWDDSAHYPTAATVWQTYH